MSCEICIEKYNNSTQNKIICEYCNFSVCKKCCEAYIIQSTHHAHCMNCKKEWTRKSLLEKLPRSFINKEYKKKENNYYLNKNVHCFQQLKLSLKN